MRGGRKRGGGEDGRKERKAREGRWVGGRGVMKAS